MNFDENFDCLISLMCTFYFHIKILHFRCNIYIHAIYILAQSTANIKEAYDAKQRPSGALAHALYNFRELSRTSLESTDVRSIVTPFPDRALDRAFLIITRRTCERTCGEELNVTRW